MPRNSDYRKVYKNRHPAAPPKLKPKTDIQIMTPGVIDATPGGISPPPRWTPKDMRMA